MPANPTTSLHPGVREAADRLSSAARTGRPCAPVRDLIGDDLAAAYAVQQEVVRERVSAGARRVGCKIGLTSAAVQRQLGVDEPDFGVLLDHMAFEDGDRVRVDELLQPRVEAEIAFVLGRDLDALGAAPAEEAVAAAVQHVVASLEVVDSRIEDWNISLCDTVADNASSGLFVLGGRRVGLDEVIPRDVVMSMTLNGALVSSGTGTASLGDPLAALAWLARTAVANGDPLRAGDVVLSGALGPVVGVTAGDAVEASFSGIGSVSAMFTDGQD